MTSKLHCDICDSVNNVEQHYFVYDRKVDAAGGMEDLGELYDLCTTCHRNVLSIYVKAIACKHTVNQELINIIKAKLKSKGK